MADSLQQVSVSAVEAGATLLEFLARHARLSRKGAKRLLDDRLVFVNRRRIWMARHALERGDRVEFPAGGAAPTPAAPPAVRYRDDAYLVVDKPPGLLSTGPDSAESRLREALGIPGLQAVHRLDRDTSGCLLLARDEPAARAAIAAFEAGHVEKVYLALAIGRFPPHVRRIAAPVDNLEAETTVRIAHAGASATLLECRPRTGRTHQIRIHLARAGHPVAGENRYHTGELARDELRRVRRQMLHAWRIKLPHPLHEGATIAAGAKPPEDFVAACRAAGIACPRGP
jgi:RluA family pseudouridine synthase